MGTLTYIKGTSGTGKSTRMRLLAEYLDSKYEYEWLNHEYITKSGAVKTTNTGKYYPEINTLLICKLVTKRNQGNIVVLEGIDNIAVGIAGSKGVDHLLRSHNDKHVIIEGYNRITGSSFRRRARYALTQGDYQYTGKVKKLQEETHEGLGFSKVLMLSFLFDNLYNHNVRILGRGGKELTAKSSAVHDNKSTIKYHNDDLARSLEDEYKDRLEMQLLLWDAPISAVETEWINWMKHTNGVEI